MKKIKLIFPEVEKKEIYFNGEKIEIIKYATPSHKCAIANYAIQTSEENMILKNENFLPITESYFKFECGFIGGVLTTMTNININKINIDDVVLSGLWEKINSSIINYSELADFVEKMYHIRKQENNLENKLNKLIDKINLFFDNISKIDWSVEGLDAMTKQLKQLEEIYFDKDKPV